MPVLIDGVNYQLLELLYTLETKKNARNLSDFLLDSIHFLGIRIINGNKYFKFHWRGEIYNRNLNYSFYADENQVDRSGVLSYLIDE
jgi:hypothetical protein